MTTRGPTPAPRRRGPTIGWASRKAHFRRSSRIRTTLDMKTYFLFHDHWTQYIKADWAASQYPFDGFVVIKKTRPWFGAYLLRRAKRIGFWKVADEVLLRLFYTLCFG